MKKAQLLIFVLLVHLIILSRNAPAFAEMYSYSKNTTVIGTMKTYTVKEGESLIEIARKFDLGYNSIESANPHLDPFVPGTGVKVRIPALWILPDTTPYDGIVINLAEMRLYYFMKKGETVMTFPIGIGREGFDTPPGTFKIVQKTVNPSWHVPKSIKLEKPELPDVVPPGPDNPLGTHALRLSSGFVLIHGTNRPWGVGRRVSHGCIRLYPEDIPKLFSLVSTGTKVMIVQQPVKAGVRDKRVYIEVHKEEGIQRNSFNNAVQLLVKKGLLKMVSTEKLYKAVREKSGMPEDITQETHEVKELVMKK
jgi:L,D-transpeptidase ErfK/SrfK